MNKGHHEKKSMDSCESGSCETKGIIGNALCDYRCYGNLILRVVVGIIFVLAGYAKLGNLAMVSQFFAGAGIPAADIMAPFVAVVEFVGGLMLITGFGARLAAIFLAIIMVVATITVKWPSGGFNAAQIDIVLLAANIAILLGGAGKYKLDKILFKRELP